MHSAHLPLSVLGLCRCDLMHREAHDDLLASRSNMTLLRSCARAQHVVLAVLQPYTSVHSSCYAYMEKITN